MPFSHGTWHSMSRKWEAVIGDCFELGWEELIVSLNEQTNQLNHNKNDVVIADTSQAL